MLQHSDGGGGGAGVGVSASAASSQANCEANSAGGGASSGNASPARGGDKATLKVHLPNGGFNLVKFGDAIDVKVIFTGLY